MYFHGFLIYVVLLIIPREEVSAQCTLPAEIQNSNWLYQSTTVVSFGTSNMQGIAVNGRGTNLDNFNCISNTGNVYVLKSASFTFRGDTKYVYMCMKLTKVSNNLFYLYFLSDQYNMGSIVTPIGERIYVPDTVPSDSDPTCTFCQYTTDPPDADVRILQRESTSETLPAGITACLPCEATCDTGPPSDSCADAHGVCKRRTHHCGTVIGGKKCKCHEVCCLIPPSKK